MASATITVELKIDENTHRILHAIGRHFTNLELQMTTIDEALTALADKVTTLTADETAERAAFDALATVVRAFIASVTATPGVLSDGQAANAQAILDSISAVDTAATTQTTDEAALNAEVAPPAAPAV